MKKNDIKKVVKALPKNTVNKVNKIHHFFYGKNKNLDKVKNEIIENNKNASFNHKNEFLLLELYTNINEDELFKVVRELQNISSSYKVEYDGFQIVLDDDKIDQPKFLPFEKFFKPESYIKILLSNNKYTYLLFLGGNTLDGYFFECLSLTDDGNASIEVLDKKERVFRQPIQGVFDPEACRYVGVTKKKILPTKFSFRLLEDNKTPEQIDEIYKRYNISESEHNSWLHLLDKILKFGSNDLVSESTMKYEVNINEKGKVKWSNILPLSTNNNNPMPFGVFLNKDKINTMFTENINELELIDKVYRGFISENNSMILKQ